MGVFYMRVVFMSVLLPLFLESLVLLLIILGDLILQVKMNMSSRVILQSHDTSHAGNAQ